VRVWEGENWEGVFLRQTTNHIKFGLVLRAEYDILGPFCTQTDLFCGGLLAPQDVEPCAERKPEFDKSWSHLPMRLPRPFSAEPLKTKRRL